MRLLFVADGPRDHNVIPDLVRRVLHTNVDASYRQWKQLRLRQGSGYNRKLRFALLQARDQELNGIVATVDSDNAKPRERLSMLCSARDEDRQNPRVSPIPTAIGEAVPHLEAWLLDDPNAVRNVLQFGGDKHIPNVLQVDPKASLDALINESARMEGPMQLFPEISRSIEIGRCNHSSKTGFDDFVKEVRAELEPLVSGSS